MSNDEIDYAEIAAGQEFAKAVATGLPLEYDDAAPVPDLPPAGAPVMIVRPIRLPFEVDATVKRIAELQGTNPSALIRRWVEDAVAERSEDDPVTELRRSLDVAQRAAAALYANRHAA
jgi:hypothetical protein